MERYFEPNSCGVSSLPHPEKQDQRQQQAQGEDEDDPLDAFMAGINQTIAKEKEESEAKLQSGVTGGSRGERFFDDEDVAADSVEYLQSLKAKEAEANTRKRKGAASDDEDVRGRVLPVIDHDRISYPPYQQDIYKEHPDISSLTLEAIGEVRDSLQLQTTGKQVPRPVASFTHVKDSLPRGLFNALTRRNYSLPTAVQAGAIPCLLKGRDCLCTAQTGSGKTAAYLLPLLARVSHLNENEDWRNKVAVYKGGSEPKKDAALGPTAMVICPTRELAVQVDGEIHAFTRDLPIRRMLLAGGFDKTDQYKQLKHGPDVVVCNPGRAIDVCGLKGLEGCFSRLVFCVVDEADKMVQMGFDSQLKEILSSLRPDRITAMFSATMPPKCEAIAQRYLRNPIRIAVGEGGQAAKSVVQKVQVVDGENGKYAWLSQNLMQLLQQVRDLAAENKQFQQQLGGVIFVNSQQRVEDLAFLLDGALQQQLDDGGLSHPSHRLLHQHAEHGDAVSRAAAARMLGGDKATDLKKNASQTYRYVATLHGGMQQAERLAVIRRMQQHYLSGSATSQHGCTEPNVNGIGRPLFLVATDVAARGLDFPPGLNLVVCYDPPNDPEVYIHRVGRAGRAGRVGLAYSVLTKQEKKQAAFIVEQMEMGGQPIPHSLMEFAMQFPPFKQARLSGLRMVWEGGKKGKELRREQRNAVYGGLGYDTGAARDDVPKANSIGGNVVPSFATAAAVAAAAAAAAAGIVSNSSAEVGDGHSTPLESGGDGSGGSGKKGRWDSTVSPPSNTSDISESGNNNNGTETATTGARRSTLNLAKREQRRQQWLSQVEARRDQQQQQRTRQASPPRRPFTERKPQDQQKPDLASEEARAAYMKAHAAAWQLETSQGRESSI